MPTQTPSCTLCKQSFDVTEDDQKFYEKMGVVIPILCPDCRFRRRSLFRNEMTLYPGTCALCKKATITMYNPNSGYTIYCAECFESDKWDPKSYAQDYDSSRPFFDQLGELLKRVPKKNTYISSPPADNPNSDYTNVAGFNKNCYLLFNSGYCEDVMYSRGVNNCTDTIDAYFALETESCYEVINTDRSYGVVFGQDVSNCTDSYLLLDCKDCSNCFGCVNLRHKSYCFFNEQLSPEEYKRRLDEILGSYAKTQEARQRFEALAVTLPRRENSNLKNEDCSGNYIFESKNVHNSFEITKGENCKYAFAIKFTKDSYDLVGHGYDSELLLEGVGVGKSNNIIASYGTVFSFNVQYSFNLRSSDNCFGCDALQKGKFCILNKEYPEQEYKQLRDQIIAELKKDSVYGLFMPPTLAPFAYNETIGQDNLPLTKEEALSFGFRWEDNLPFTTGKETLKSENIPDNIRDAKDSLLNEVLACTECKRNYKITKAELAFYRKMNIPIPRRCFQCRHLDRLKRRGPFKLFERTCDHCKKDIKTTYAPDSQFKVYCEACYQKEII
jgi:hypothetical protein